MDRPAVLRRVVDLARLAPSVHNTQPWRWAVVGTSLELWADRTRGLPVSDPLDRNLVISCGCALQHAAVAAEGLGATAEIAHLPEGPDSDLLARIDLQPTKPAHESVARLDLLRARHTDRRRFTSWPVAAEELERLAAAGAAWGATVLPAIDAELRQQLEALLEDARRHQLADPRVADEAESWIDHGEHDGIPAFVLPAHLGVRGERPSRFGPTLTPDDAADTAAHAPGGTDRLLVISTEDDGPLSWLRAGESLSALWLQATEDGLSVVPLSQLVEVPRTRHALERLLPQPARVPQLLVRVGWQQIGRNGLPRTPRRPLDEVLRSRPG